MLHLYCSCTCTVAVVVVVVYSLAVVTENITVVYEMTILYTIRWEIGSGRGVDSGRVITRAQLTVRIFLFIMFLEVFCMGPRELPQGK